MRRPLFSWLLAVTFTAGCGNGDVLDPGDRAALRLYNAVPDSPPVDINLRGATVTQGLAFGFGRFYALVQSGSAQIDVINGTTDDIILGHSAVLQTGAAYTFVAAGTMASPQGLLFTDDTSAAPSGSFKVRMLQLAPLGPAMDLYITDAAATDITTATPAVTGLAFTKASAYVTGTAGSVRLWVTEAGTKTVLRNHGPVTIASGQGGTLLVIGKAGAGGGGAPFSTQLIADHAGTN
jgi:hypothetical protein